MQAVDIVLLFSDETNNALITLNQSFTPPRKIDFERDGTLPHLSLWKGVVNDQEKKDMTQYLKQISYNFPLDLKIQ